MSTTPQMFNWGNGRAWAPGGGADPVLRLSCALGSCFFHHYLSSPSQAATRSLDPIWCQVCPLYASPPPVLSSGEAARGFQRPDRWTGPA